MPVNIGSDEVISIQDLTELIITIGNKELKIKNISGPTGVQSRTSHNALILKEINWAPNYPLKKGVEKTYQWIAQQIIKKPI
jgi:nucleoside-diphosphate-sugar epimerase